MNNQDGPNDLRFGSFRIDLSEWRIFDKDGTRLKGVGFLPVRILKHIIDNRPEIVRGTDGAVLAILSHYKHSDEEEQHKAFMKYISTLRRAMGRTEFDALFPNVRRLDSRMGGYKFVGDLPLLHRPTPEELKSPRDTPAESLKEATVAFESEGRIELSTSDVPTL